MYYTSVIATAVAFVPAILLQRSSRPTVLVWFEPVNSSEFVGPPPPQAFQLATSRTADTAETWYLGVSARAENVTGGYDIWIVKNGNTIVPNARVEYAFTYDKAGNLIAATVGQAAVAKFGTLGPAVSGLGVRNCSTIDAVDRPPGAPARLSRRRSERSPMTKTPFVTSSPAPGPRSDRSSSTGSTTVLGRS